MGTLDSVQVAVREGPSLSKPHPSQSKKLARAQRKLKEAELKLKRAERSVELWRRKVADLTFERKCVTQPPLWADNN
ncbi:hypothetical protein [Edaphobacter modestus]|uniref:Transposase n=1 Tax=Edaphobacter modestus TaxID=388466 RepID=A0A4Q7XXB3_9BACT|nr:hypothetical protein [Edaphobacter modestus]RZU28997.1 hypothetical protein BDD14_6585 [Edaphobacter modestus]